MLCFYLVFLFDSVGQVNESFVKHLSDNNLKREYLQYIETSNLAPDSLDYYRAKYHLQFGQDSAFFASLDNCRELFMKDSLATTYSHYHFLTRGTSMSSRWFSSLDEDIAGRGLPLLYTAAYQPLEFDRGIMPQQLQPDFLRLQKASSKKPLMAGFLSALVPGAGKAYIGNYRSFLITFVSLGLMGWQTWESYNKLGIQNPLTIINGSILSLYYVVNVFGSFRETKEKKKRIRNQYLVNVSNYHRASYTGSLY